MEGEGRGGKGKGSVSFYSAAEFHEWRVGRKLLLAEDGLESGNEEGVGGGGGSSSGKYKVKYYKGLGTSTSAEGREYFAHLGMHVTSPVNPVSNAIYPSTV